MPARARSTRLLSTFGAALSGCLLMGSAAQLAAAPRHVHTLFSAARPKLADAHDRHSVEVGVKFVPKASGSIVGLRFYKSVKNTGRHVGSLWNGDGKLLARVVFRHETRSGWQTAYFRKPAKVRAGKVYVAGYLAPHGHYSLAMGALKSSRTAGPLTALGNDVSPDGVYAYSRGSSFPSTAYRASSYYVDVQFVRLGPGHGPGSAAGAPTGPGGAPGSGPASGSGGAPAPGSAGSPGSAPSAPVTARVPVTCDLAATPANLQAEIAAAKPGQTVCLAAGSYGNWSGANKVAPGITITTQPGAAVTMGFDFSLASVQNFTVDGGENGGSISTPDESMGLEGATTTPRNITIRNVHFDGAGVSVDIDDPVNSNITFDHDSFNGSDCMTAATGIRLHLSYGGGNGPSGVTVSNSEFVGGSSDGIQSGVAMTIRNNYFADVEETRAEASSCHTDAIQFYGMSGGQTVISGNWFVDTSDGIGSWNGDSAPGYLIENNVFDHQQEEDAMAIQEDHGSTIIHNTCIAPAASCVNLVGTSASPSTGTVVKDNIFDTATAYDKPDATPAQIADNMIAGTASGSDFKGTPVFSGGASFPLASFTGYALTAGSPGHGRADDGTDVGADPVATSGYGPGIT